MDEHPTEIALQVICLCADWCGVCRAWLPVLREIAGAHPEVHFSWIDIEDESEALGDLDIDTFPTLLVTAAGAPRFFGPIEPSRHQLERLLEGLRVEDQPQAHAMLPSVHALAKRLAPLLHTATV